MSAKSITRELWRFSCENCGSVVITKRRETNHAMSEFSHFSCKNCGEKNEFAYDKKTGNSVHYSNL